MEALSATSVPPGFGFHPTDVELISHYLKRKVLGLKIDYNVISEVDIYKHEPWDLPAKCNIPTRDSKWHFFASRDRKYPKGSRTSRATKAGYWKSTGKDRSIKVNSRIIGTKKTLVFHEGRPPSGKRTDWIMHEYYLGEKECKTTPHLKDAFVLCRVTKRNGWGLEACEDEEISTGPEQTNNIAGAITCTESSSQSADADDIDKWVNELFDPHFCGASLDEQQIEAMDDLAALALKLEPMDSLEQSFPNDAQYLVADDILGILQSDEVYNDVLQDPSFAAPTAAFSASIYLPAATDDPLCLMSSIKEETESRRKHTSYDETDFGSLNVCIDAGIQVRKRHTNPTVISNNRARLKVQLHKMETRNAESINQTIKFLDQHSQLTMEFSSISTYKPTDGNRSDFPRVSKSYTDDLKSKACTQIRRSGFRTGGRRRPFFDGTSCIQGIISGLFMLLRDCLSAGLNGLLVAACLVGTAALIIYFLLCCGHQILAAFSSLG